MENVLCVRALAAERLFEDLRRELPSVINSHGDKVFSVPVDGAVYPVLPPLARVFLMRRLLPHHERRAAAANQHRSQPRRAHQGLF